MAAPVVAGVAALLRAYFPALTAEQIKEVLIQSSMKPNYQVRLPGGSRMVTLEEISVAGGMINAYTAARRAMNTKGKKKIKSVKVIRP